MWLVANVKLWSRTMVSVDWTTVVVLKLQVDLTVSQKYFRTLKHWCLLQSSTFQSFLHPVLVHLSLLSLIFLFTSLKNHNDASPCMCVFSQTHLIPNSFNSVTFIGLNIVRILSIIALVLVFASSIVVMVHDIQAVNHFVAEGKVADNSTSTDHMVDCDYIEFVYNLPLICILLG